MYDVVLNGFAEPTMKTNQDVSIKNHKYSASSNTHSFTVERDFDPGDDEHFIVEEESIELMGFALRTHDVVSKSATGDVTEFGSHTRYGFFNYYLWSNKSTSYWGVYVDSSYVLDQS